MSKLCSKQEDPKISVYAFINLNLDAGKNFIARHFLMNRQPKSTIKDII